MPRAPGGALAAGSYGLTPTQQAFWLGQKLNQGTPCYNMVFTLAIGGELDHDRFQRAFRTLLDNVATLRTVFVEDDAGPHQHERKRIDYEVEYVDLSASPEPDAALRDWVAARALVSLDLESQPFDTALLKLGPQRFVWHLNIHHLLADGWSFGRVVQTMSEYYAFAGKDHLSRPEPLPTVQDYTAGVLARKPGARFEESAAYWRRKTRRTVDPVVLYGISGANRTARERRERRDLGPALTQRLTSLAASSRAGPLGVHFSTLSLLSAVMFAYLHKVTGNREFSIGVPFHQRATDVERAAVGLLQQTVPLRVCVDEDDTVASLLSKTKRETWESMRHAYRCAGSLQIPAAFDVLINYQAISFPDFAGLKMTAEWVHTGFGDGSRTMFLQAHDFGRAGNLALDFDMNEGVFSADQQSRAASQYLQILEAFLGDENQLVAELPLLNASEKQRIVTEFNRTSRTYPGDATVSHLFEEQARRTPDRIAVAFGDEQLTYRELDARSDRMANQLRTHGVGPNVLVAVCAERSVELVVGLLALFKAGGVYVPLDASYPKERQALMLEDSGARVLLTQQRLLPQLPAHDGVTLCLDDHDISASGATPGELQAVTPSDLAYVIYTSGSTGRPKGVAMSQRALANLIQWQIREATRLPAPRTLQFTPLSFDVSLQEVFSTWCSGGTLVLISDDARRDPAATLHLLIEAEIEQLYIIYTPLQQLAEAAGRLGLFPTSLREVITAGEQVQITPQIVRFFEKLPECTFHNQYGPSETHIVTAYTLTGPPETWPSLPSIGTPVANTTCYILDSSLQPVPVGVTGELYIGGAQVADGYLGRPELTAERFVADTFSGGDGDRMYKTGDLARYFDDGNIDFLGRADNQIKLRGYRIELGEIETVMRWHEAVKEGVVSVRQDRRGDRRLIGYVVPFDDDDASVRQLPRVLRDFLSEKLPAYMVPYSIEVIASIPRTPNEKVDRLALPAPNGLRPDIDTDYAAPRTDIEEAIACVWQELLEVDRVGRHDDFFSLGGHSLLLVEAHTELQSSFARDLTITDLFRFPTVAALAGYLAGTTTPAKPTQRIQERARRQRESTRRSRQRGRSVKNGDHE